MMSKTKLHMEEELYDPVQYIDSYTQPTNYERSQGFNYDSKQADQNIKYCTSCDRCYEVTNIKNSRKKNPIIIFYDDFPTYGKTKDNCPVCKGVPTNKVMNENIVCYEILDGSWHLKRFNKLLFNNIKEL